MTRVSFRLYSGDSLRERETQFCDSSPSTKAYGEVPMNNENDTIGGYAIPLDPMDDLQCDSCQ